MYIWNTNRLAVALANHELSPDEKFKYLLFSSSMYSVAGYLAWFFVIGSGGRLFWIEALIILLITVYGLIRCKDQYSSSREDRLLESFVVLSVPLGVKLLLFSWGGHLAIRYSLAWLMPKVAASNETIHAVVSAFNIANDLYAFVIALLGTALYYWRLGVHLETVARGSNLHPYSIR